VGGTAAVSAGLGALAGRSVLHSLAVGYYVVGAAVLVGCFVLGSRGPLRRDVRDDEENPPVMVGSVFSSYRLPYRRRSARKATPEERREAKLASLGLFALAVLLIMIGAAVDPAHRAF
jgi:hypothetical protein